MLLHKFHDFLRLWAWTLKLLRGENFFLRHKSEFVARLLALLVGTL